ncbi:hypothetical protein G7L40_00355 [Paenibacillus polymyxa]|uniref:Uncharacterized protein n=1 Tax=Paenibacillus polymyxa TaxID=1406 RepID=A0A378XWI2_PAEPO|nr:hypothetical protein [Paenibacillus polymyxa]MBE7897161.1 hypothetical protein [Paenibacillus polymyxa]MCC3257590.1 hypothetical protein [Paenibacillus polymyxa]QPK51327.1 hypothetical protein G7035_00355 [Paenibacillus polymyxa]QPK56417.1 hypothetical protein G7L40_00355 [Paenibacillus polymyxa]SUA68436.1 Uncharacterised protein [Paenibacillus polymyxa]
MKKSDLETVSYLFATILSEQGLKDDATFRIIGLAQEKLISNSSGDEAIGMLGGNDEY